MLRLRRDPRPAPAARGSPGHNPIPPGAVDAVAREHRAQRSGDENFDFVRMTDKFSCSTVPCLICRRRLEASRCRETPVARAARQPQPRRPTGRHRRAKRRDGRPVAAKIPSGNLPGLGAAPCPPRAERAAMRSAPHRRPARPLPRCHRGSPRPGQHPPHRAAPPAQLAGKRSANYCGTRC